MFSVTGSEYCSVDANTVLYDWCYDQFLPLETFVLLQDDRKYWADKQHQEEMERNNQQQR